VFDSTVFANAQVINLSGSPLELSDTTGTEQISGPAAGVTINAGGLSGVMQVDAGVTAELDGLTLTGGSATNGGGLLNDGGTVSLFDVTLSGNTASNNGGGLYTENYGMTTLDQCVVAGNSAVSGGGVSISSNSTTDLTDSTNVGYNTATFGGGVYNQGTTSLSEPGW